MECSIEETIEDTPTGSTNNGGVSGGFAQFAVGAVVVLGTLSATVNGVVAQAPAIPYTQEGPRVPGYSFNEFLKANGGNLTGNISGKYTEWAKASGLDEYEINAGLMQIGGSLPYANSVILTADEIADNIAAANAGKPIPYSDTSIPSTTGIALKGANCPEGELLLGMYPVIVCYKNGKPVYDYINISDNTNGLASRFAINAVNRNSFDPEVLEMIGTSAYNWGELRYDIRTGVGTHVGNMSYADGLSAHRRYIDAAYDEVLVTGTGGKKWIARR